MCLVNGEQGDFGALQQTQHAHGDKALGGHIKQIKITIDEGIFDLVAFLRGKGGI